MNRPSLQTYLFGNSISLIAIILLFVFVAYKWLAGDAPWFFALAMFFAAAHSSRCAKEVRDYEQWKCEWDAMSGATKGPSLFQRAPWARVIAGIALWLGVMWLALKTVDESYKPILIGSLWVGGSVIVGYGLFSMRRALNIKNATKAVNVSVSLSVPGQSPDLKQAYSALPEYCADLMRR